MGVNARITERGNGLPDAGDKIYDQTDDTIYLIDSIDGPIHTGQPGAGNYVWAKVSPNGESASDLSDEEFDDLTDAMLELADE
jgi:hypothetical protein